MLTDFIIFGAIDNFVMLLGMLGGVSVEQYFPKKYQVGSGFYGAVGAGLGNSFSDFCGGLGAGNMELAIGSGLGCLIVLILIPVYFKFNKEVK